MNFSKAKAAVAAAVVTALGLIAAAMTYLEEAKALLQTLQAALS